MSNWNQRSRGNYGDRDREPRRDRDGPAQRFPNQGSLWPNERGGPKSPEQKGSFKLSDEVLDYIVREVERGSEDVTLEIAGWGKMTQDNRNFLSISVSIPYKVQMEEQGNPTYRQPRPNFNKRQEERPVRQSYAERSGRTDRRPQRDDDFARGDSMPDFLRDDDDNDAPW